MSLHLLYLKQHKQQYSGDLTLCYEIHKRTWNEDAMRESVASADYPSHGYH